jgi:carbamoyl-phosphate synthase large subunit
MLNFNPETVSTDFDSSDILYFDEISLERIQDIYEWEKPIGVIISMGGQIGNNLATKLQDNGIHIIGTNPKDIYIAEDRKKFSKLLDSISVEQPKWAELTNLKQAEKFWEKHGYPVIIRPSYILSGANMRVCIDKQQLKNFLTNVTHISKEHPTVISKFEIGAKEIEVDGVGQNGKLIIYAISEHIENAGVHSGDATVVLPAQKLYIETLRKIKRITKRIIKELNITGPFNTQHLAKENEIKVIECNLRASRSFPFVSKITKYNFIEIATRAILGEDVSGEYNTLDLDYVGVKAPQFSFHRLKGADPKLGIEMASTGEVWCLWDTVHEAFLTAMLSVGIKIPKKIFLLVFEA